MVMKAIEIANIINFPLTPTDSQAEGTPPRQLVT